MIKIAISGKAKSGKNTLSDLIIKSLYKNLPTYYKNKKRIQSCAFADPIKEMGNIIFPGEIHEEHFWGPSENREKNVDFNYTKYDYKSDDNIEYEEDLTYRKVLMDIGSLGRKYDKNIWINLLLRKCQKAELDKYSLFVVNDLRFKNEFNALSDNDFFLIRIKRKDSNKINDISETDQDGISDKEFDYVIDNNSTKKQLKQSIIPMIDKIKKEFGSF